MITLTVFYEESFWVGVFEQKVDNKYQVAKNLFFSKPKDEEIYNFILEEYEDLQFSKPIPTTKVKKKKINPKRLQRKISKKMNKTGVGTKAQQALQQQREQNKKKKKQYKKKQKDRMQQRKFRLKQEKKKQKKKGR
ncbi:Protein of unknown function (DUF2992) [Orenia metallireducens]|uniref:DUF2992 domain-containing protein n=1 Tax=Orenia metallireducens TaxID=1413210 RepID=A0A285I3I4_9FIRM|nr:YjdF family protein [Orenia metallireducens]PRX23136.1 Protein of unknown function (DUF2992) [Orenia metallireducens]SNY42545.1 Protein of unknown function [Orenia metallireducens]